jgi:hypothetical protein
MDMTRKEADRLNRQESVLMSLGFTAEEAEKLRRISMTLQRWHELECGNDRGCIERDGENGDGKPFMTYDSMSGARRRYPIADRERGAQKRLLGIINAEAKRHGECRYSAYIQTDPRGAALYILRPGDVPAGKDAGAYYNRGICVY